MLFLHQLYNFDYLNRMIITFIDFGVLNQPCLPGIHFSELLRNSLFLYRRIQLASILVRIIMSTSMRHVVCDILSL